MVLIKTKKIGKYRIDKYPKAIWVSELPYHTQVKRFSSFSDAERWVKNRIK